MIFVLPDGRRHDAEVSAGSSVLMAARRADVAIEGACGGSMACATCHVHVDEDWFDRLPPPSAEEEEMLDFAETPAPTSRLGCQIRLVPELDGLIVRVPRTSLLLD
jgi:2Fe-2S ferredoxin